MITEKVSTLKINTLSRAQYKRELDAGRIENTALYLTPDTTPDIVQMTMEQYNAAEQAGDLDADTVYIIPDKTPNIVQMSQAEYNVAASAGTLDDDTIYIIPEAEKVINNATNIVVTVEDQTEYYFPNATHVVVNLPTGTEHYESWLFIGGANATIEVLNGTCLGITQYAGSYNTSCAEVSIKDGRYLIATDCIN